MSERINHNLYDVIVRPIITEATMMRMFAEKEGTDAGSEDVAQKYFFEVKLSADKPEIREAVEKLFSVKVKSVNTLVRKGKLKTFRGHRAVRSDTKRAIVTLEKGHKIDYSGGVGA